MADGLACEVLSLLKDGGCQVECIVVDDEEDAEEDVLFINSGYTSASTQTDSRYFNAYQPNTPGVPIFFCGQPSPGTATTQCCIPQLVSVCVGTDPLGTCPAQQQGTHLPARPSTSVSGTLSASCHTEVTPKIELVLSGNEGGHVCFFILTVKTFSLDH